MADPYNKWWADNYNATQIYVEDMQKQLQYTYPTNTFTTGGSYYRTVGEDNYDNSKYLEYKLQYNEQIDAHKKQLEEITKLENINTQLISINANLINESFDLKDEITKLKMQVKALSKKLK